MKVKNLKNTASSNEIDFVWEIQKTDHYYLALASYTLLKNKLKKKLIFYIFPHFD